MKEDEARAENVALIESLKKSVRSAELSSEDYQHQLAATQQKMDDLMQDHAKLEERFHESVEKIEELEAQQRESSRHLREMENIYESEKVAMLKDREEAISRESDLKSTIQRLKETMAGREARLGNEPGRRSPRPGMSQNIMLAVNITNSTQAGLPHDRLQQMKSINSHHPLLSNAVTPRVPPISLCRKTSSSNSYD